MKLWLKPGSDVVYGLEWWLYDSNDDCRTASIRTIPFTSQSIVMHFTHFVWLCCSFFGFGGYTYGIFYLSIKVTFTHLNLTHKTSLGIGTRALCVFYTCFWLFELFWLHQQLAAWLYHWHNWAIHTHTQYEAVVWASAITARIDRNMDWETLLFVAVSLVYVGVVYWMRTSCWSRVDSEAAR